MKPLIILFPLMLAGPQIGAAQAPQQAQVCANQALCYETADFAATVTDFRTSVSGGYHIVDATLHIQNKTSNQLVLGYNNGSGTALDDQGVRYSVGGGNALRGMGLVNGQSFDPKFSLPPGGYGDVRFELLGAGAQVYGLSYQLDITVSEINTLEGNQHTLGGEFPLQFQGLANGVRGAASGMSAGQGGSMSAAPGMLLASTGTSAPNTAANGTAGPCVPTGAANALSGVTNSAAVQNAQAVISSLGTLFGRNTQAAPAATATNAPTSPCVAPASAAGSAATAPTAVTHLAAATNNTAAAPTSLAAKAKAVVVKAPPAAAPAKPQAKIPAGTKPTAVTATTGTAGTATPH